MMLNVLNNIFSNREIATGIWLLIFIAFVFISSRTRKAAKGVLRAACTKKLVIPFFIMICYAGLLVYWWTFLSLWKWIYIKDVTVWVLFAGIPICFKAVEEHIDTHYFFNMVINNLKFTVFVEFIISVFTFSLIAELAIIPVLTFIFMLDAVAGMKEEFIIVKKLLTWLLAIAGFIFICCTFKEALASYQTIGILDSIVSFCIPIILSVFYVPIAYFFAVYAKYEIVFIRMSFKEPTDKTIRCKHRFAILKSCGLSYKNLCRFEEYYIKNMYVTMKQTEFDNLIRNFKSNCF
ncbi:MULTISPECIES: hypothetical protein [Clostridium]|uniref:Uncharacterized protein n=2 Tax=Clostridium TaxID=1485 RepID=A0AAE6I5U8_CLOSG|nr:MULTISPECIES: hypothetical protein [Clostridium]MBE6077105.1 hypothetical protein [Clostridium lundense]MDU2834344.1 hypothetical protein [Clostridium botulinum]MDU4548010.1 hypothetical protein [Clostridium botulinum]MDU5011198.1 hypothetical protein [Clostridium botulinum]MDU5116827.1 hypothetical protein [Clostridium botulinum]